MSLLQNILSLYTEAAARRSLCLYPVDPCCNPSMMLTNNNSDSGEWACAAPGQLSDPTPVPAACSFHHIFSVQCGPAKKYWPPCEFWIYLSIYLVDGGTISSGPLVSGRDKHAGCEATEKPHRLSLVRKREMKRKTEGWKEEKRKVWLSDRRRERGNQREKKRQKDRWMGHGFHPLSLVSLQGKPRLIFSSRSFPLSCQPLVISQHKTLRISPDHRGCSQMLLNQQHSRQSLNKCLIKPLQRCGWMCGWFMRLVKNENAFKKSPRNP